VNGRARHGLKAVPYERFATACVPDAPTAYVTPTAYVAPTANVAPTAHVGDGL
jgi:hypothetical protein